MVLDKEQFSETVVRFMFELGLIAPLLCQHAASIQLRLVLAQTKGTQDQAVHCQKLAGTSPSQLAQLLKLYLWLNWQANWLAPDSGARIGNIWSCHQTLRLVHVGVAIYPRLRYQYLDKEVSHVGTGVFHVTGVSHDSLHVLYWNGVKTCIQYVEVHNH